MESWFGACRTVEEAKARYRDLMKQYHPDLGGNTETCQQINAALDAWLADGMGAAFRSYEQATGKGFAEDRPYVFADIIARIVRMPGVGRIEVIGYWVYAFESFEAREGLKSMGFWFSSKHKAWVYSGGRKIPIRATCTTAQLHQKWDWATIEKETPSIMIGAR